MIHILSSLSPPLSLLCASGVDYKLLMSGQEDKDPLVLLTPALTYGNVGVVARLADKIPCGASAVLTSGMVFCAYALKLFWKGGEEKRLKTTKVRILISL